MQKNNIKWRYVKASQCIKIVANHDLKQIILRDHLFSAYKDDNELIQVQNQVMSDYNHLKELLNKDKGVCVKSSALGSLEALLNLLKSKDVPVFDFSIGPINKKDMS